MVFSVALCLPDHRLDLLALGTGELRNTSSGCPFFSYMANRKKGSITRIMHSAAVVVPRLAFVKKKSGTPASAADPKQITCRLVSPNRTLLSIRLRSFGIVT